MLVVMAHRPEQIGDVVVVQGVVDVAPLLASADQPQRPQNAQMVRGGAGPEVNVLGELLDGPFPRQQRQQETKPACGAERPQGLGQLVGLCRGEVPGGRGVFAGMRHCRIP